METDPETVVSRLILRVACFGHKGCSVSGVLENARKLFTHDSSAGSIRLNFEACKGFEAAAWRWLIAQGDVSVGKNRQWNHLQLEEVLAIPEEDAFQEDTGAKKEKREVATVVEPEVETAEVREQTSSPRDQPAQPRALPKTQPRVYVSERAAWQALAGHDIDYQRIPRSPWEALLGIASTGEDGILQGDLSRLVAQDKRSLPKRTDMLADKGYIIKRTTLAKGSKTSKLWLKQFAPDFATDSGEVGKAGEEDVDMSPEVLCSTNEPVPWKDRWCRDQVDFITLTKTAVAIIKAFRVMRLVDLKAKLGVEGSRRHMKVVATLCRFLAMRGCTKYVVATWDNRILRDCVKFVRDLNADDWKNLLATAAVKKQKASASGTSLGDGSADREEHRITVDAGHLKGLPIQSWSIDKPLVNTISDLVQRSGKNGLTTMQLVNMTLGPSFRSYITNLASFVAFDNIQPPNLQHLRISRDRRRDGKAIHFQFFSPSQRRIFQGEDAAPRSSEGLLTVDESVKEPSGTEQHGPGGRSSHVFNPTLPIPELRGGVRDLLDLNQVMRVQRKLQTPRDNTAKENGEPKRPRGRPRKNPPVEFAITGMEDPEVPGVPQVVPGEAAHDNQTDSQVLEDLVDQALGTTISRPPVSAGDNTSGTIETKMTPEGDTIVQVDQPVELPGQSAEMINPRGGTTVAGNDNETNRESTIQFAASHTDASSIQDEEEGEAMETDLEKSAAVRPAGSGRGRGRGRGSGRGKGRERGKLKSGMGQGEQQAGPITNKNWKCEKCGGSWKNDLGLKYHLTKSRTSCNASFSPFSLQHLRSPQARRSGREIISSSPAKELQGHVQGTTNDSLSEPAEPNLSRSPDGFNDVSTSVVVRGSATLPTKPSPNSDDSSTQVKDVCVVDTQKVKTSDTLGAKLSNKENGVDNITRRRRISLSEDTHALLIPTSMVRRSVTSGKARFGLLPEALSRPTNVATKETEIALTSQAGKIDISPLDSHKIGKASQLTITSHNERKPTQFPVPIGETGKKQSHKQVLKDRIYSALAYLVDSNNGVFPGGQSLWIALEQVWRREWPTVPPPDNEVREQAFRRMLNKKMLREHVHSFRTPAGTFATFKIVLHRDKGPSAAEVRKVIAQIKGAYPASYVPPISYEKPKRQDLRDSVVSVAGRRMLVGKLEILDAPFYAGASERRKRSQRTSLVGVKRIKFDPSFMNDFDVGDVSQMSRGGGGGDMRQKRTRAALSSNRDNNHINSSTKDKQGSQNGRLDGSKATISYSRLRFLEPNTFLGEDVAEQSLEFEAPKTGCGRQISSLTSSTSASQFKPRFAPLVTISPNRTDDHQMWPSLEVAYFEKNDASVTVKGWMPDQAWLDLELLPIRARGLFKRRMGNVELLTDDPDHVEYCRFVENLTAFRNIELQRTYLPPRIPKCGWPSRIFINFTRNWRHQAIQSQKLNWTAENQVSVGDANFFDRFPSTDEDESEDEDDDGDDDADAEHLATHGWTPRRRKETRNRARHAKPIESRRQVVLSDLKTRVLSTLPEDAGQSTISSVTDFKERDRLENRLVVAFVVTRTLVGGAEMSIDWGLLMRLFPDLSLDELRRFWFDCRKYRSSYVARLAAEFQNEFIKAYDKEEVPAIDYDDIASYDWSTLIDWAMRLSVDEDVKLPVRASDLDKKYSLEQMAAPTEHWHEKFFLPSASIFTRFEAATGEAAALAIRDLGPLRPLSDERIQVAWSWVKALCGTGSGKYTSRDIRNKFSELCDGDEVKRTALLERAIKELMQRKVISKAIKGGRDPRPYRLSEQFYTTLGRVSRTSKYREAATFKERLDDAFGRGQKVRLPYNVKDGVVMALVNLQGHGRVTVVPVNVPHVPMGFVPGRYETRKLPKSSYGFDVEVVPTTTYVYDREIAVVLGATADVAVPRKGPHGEIPVWCDLYGQLDRHRWSLLFGGFAFALATRGLLTGPAMCAALKPLVDQFEVDMMTDWGKRVGLLEKKVAVDEEEIDHVLRSGDGGSNGGPSDMILTEWWWLIVARLYETSKEIPARTRER